MSTLVVSGLVLLVLLLMGLFWHKHSGGKSQPYALQEALLGPAERAFLAVLDLAVGGEARIFAKVRIGEALLPEAKAGKRKGQQAADPVGGGHFDYLLCDPQDLSILCAVVLDDSAHRHQKRRPQDSALKMACDSAGLPLLQIPASAHYQVEELREQILPLLIRTEEPLAEPASGGRREPTFGTWPLAEREVADVVADAAETRAHAPTVSWQRPEIHHEAQAPAARWQEEEIHHEAHAPAAHWQEQEACHDGHVPLETQEPLSIGEEPEPVTRLFAAPDDDDAEEEEFHASAHCPRCDALLVEREARKGPHAGRMFLACSRFPACRYAVPRA